MISAHACPTYLKFYGVFYNYALLKRKQGDGLHRPPFMRFIKSIIVLEDVPPDGPGRLACLE